MPTMHVMIPHTPNFRSAQKELSENAFFSIFGKEAIQPMHYAFVEVFPL